MNLPIFTDVPDVRALAEQLGGNVELTQRIAHQFTVNAQTLLRAMGNALQRKDGGLAASFARDFQKDVERFRSRTLASAAQRVETLARRGDIDEAQDALALLSAMTERYLPVLREAARALSPT